MQDEAPPAEVYNSDGLLTYGALSSPFGAAFALLFALCEGLAASGEAVRPRLESATIISTDVSAI